jgi:Rrf2 family protein
MAHIGTGVEYGLHCLLWLVDSKPGRASVRDLAELQGVSPSYVAKIFPKLDKGGIVEAQEGFTGGYRLAKPADQITVLEVIEAIDGKKPLFDCQQIRGRCAVFGDAAPGWATGGVCAVHAVMIRAEQVMREELAKTTLADIAHTLNQKAPAQFAGEIREWLADRVDQRSQARLAGIASSKESRQLDS